MQEIELKFQVPASARRAVASAVAGAGRPARVRLQAAYYDTAGRALAAAGMALRVRREGRRWVQTLKRAGNDGMTRFEHNVALSAAGTVQPPVDPERHAGTVAGERLLEVLAACGETAGVLQCRYRTDIHRRTRRLAVGALAADAIPDVARLADQRAGAGSSTSGAQAPALRIGGTLANPTAARETAAREAPAREAPAREAAAQLAAPQQTAVDPAAVEQAVADEAVAGRVELAFDDGAIVAGDRRLAVCELEVESIDGSPLAVIATASRWVERHGLWLDTRSKAERGDLLARAETVAPPHSAEPLRLTAKMGPMRAVGAVLLNCFDQIAVNASQVASGVFLPEHVHQLRIGLRRLRSALALFVPPQPRPNADDDDGHRADKTQRRVTVLADTLRREVVPVGRQAAVLSRQLGAARDADAIAESLTGAISRALRSVGVVGDLPAPAATEAADPAACVRAGENQQLLLTLLRLGQRLAGPAALLDANGANGANGANDDTPKSLRRQVERRLRHWHRQVGRDARRLASLDDEARHRLRKRAKRLRYAVEFVAALYPTKAVAAYLKPLRRLQDRLGALNDVAVAIEAYRGVKVDESRALFAMGWLASQRVALLGNGRADTDAFTTAAKFWNKR